VVIFTFFLNFCLIICLVFTIRFWFRKNKQREQEEKEEHDRLKKMKKERKEILKEDDDNAINK